MESTTDVIAGIPTRPTGRRCRPRLLAAFMATCLVAAAATRLDAATAYGLTTTNQLVVFDTAAPGTILATVTITGLQPGEAILAIDVRPATGQLYALGSTSRLYRLNPVTGAATQVGTPFSVGLLGASFGFDFNPTVDRIRVVSDAEQNLRLHPDTGAVAATDTALTPDGTLVAAAYSNNFAGASVTTLYGIDSTSDQLVRQGGPNGTPSPNGGVITPIGPLGVDVADNAGFDITANDGVAYAALSVGGVTSLYTINLTTGAATVVGALGGGTALRGLAVLSRGVTLFGVTTTNQLIRFHSALPGTILNTIPITGLQMGEFIVGLDARPATSQLYALGSTSRVYQIHPATGAAVEVGTGPFTPALSGAEFGFDFNPVADRIRVVSNSGQNLRLNADTGAVAATDTAISPPAVTTAGVAYSNNVDGTTVTTLYGIDAAADSLVLIGGLNGTPSPNGGVTTVVGPLGVDTTFTGGFDISPLDNVGFAALTVGGTAQLYTIDLVSGLARAIGAINVAVPVRALAAVPTSYHLAEGSTGTFFDTDLLLLNPNLVPAPATITYLAEGGSVVTSSLTLAAQSRTTVQADTVPGLASTAFSSVVSSHLGLPLVVERTMRWDPTGYGTHTEKAADGLARTWYFAEGSQGFFQTFFLLTNPSPVANSVTMRFLLEGGTTVTRTYPLGPQSRLTIFAGAIPELVNQSFGTVATFNFAGGAERAMYFGTTPLFNAGHESAGVIQPATSWFLAEGATGTFFTTFVLLANPGTTVANVTLTYLREGGGTVTKVKTLQPGSRLTVNVALEDATLAATAVATRVTSDVPIVAERAQYWPFTPPEWQEAHNSFGVTSTASKWGLAEGRVGGAEQYQTFILMANPDTVAANVTLMFMRTTGAPITKTALVPANGRLTVSTGPGTLVPELADESFGVVITSDRPIFVERALYSNAGGIFWAAGTNATATAIP